jgi:microcin C transport system substrate-binding protein
LRILAEAGFEVREQRLVHAASARPVSFEILLVSPDFERIVLPFKKNLERLGVEVRVRTVDSAQYQKRLDEFDFDVVVGNFGITMSPGNEQREFWHSSTADRSGSRNFAGVKDPVVDALVDSLIAAPDRGALVDRTRALDRVLQWGHYVIPNWHIDSFRVAYWDIFGRPPTAPKYSFGFNTWWFDPERAATVARHRTRAGG